LERKASLGADGYRRLSDVPIPQPGRSHLRIDALPDFGVPAHPEKPI
jgi:copper transport protein